MAQATARLHIIQPGEDVPPQVFVRELVSNRVFWLVAGGLLFIMGVAVYAYKIGYLTGESRSRFIPVYIPQPNSEEEE